MCIERERLQMFTQMRIPSPLHPILFQTSTPHHNLTQKLNLLSPHPKLYHLTLEMVHTSTYPTQPIYPFQGLLYGGSGVNVGSVRGSVMWWSVPSEGSVKCWVRGLWCGGSVEWGVCDMGEVLSEGSVMWGKWCCNVAFYFDAGNWLWPLMWTKPRLSSCCSLTQ